jgi:dTDP-4-dehydrorhamnose reductase
MVSQVISHYSPDFIINAAAYTAVDQAEKELEKAFAVNARGPELLAQQAKAKDIPIIHYSTDYVFDGTKNSPYKESDPVAPLGVYGQSKLAGEQAVQACSAKYIILRTSWVFGLQGHNFPKTMLRLASERAEIGVVADQLGCPTFADDIANTSLELANMYDSRKVLPWGLFHYGGEESCSWYDFACYIMELAVEEGIIGKAPVIKPLKSSEYRTSAVRPENSRLCCDHFHQTFPELFLSDWKQGVKFIITEYAKNSHLYTF